MKTQMRRTQVYLSTEQTAALDRLARRRGTTRSELLRLAAQQFLDEENNNQDHSIRSIVGLGRSGTTDTSAEHDRVLSDLALHSRKT